MEDLRFSSEEEALQYFADITGEKVVIAADKYEEKAHPAVKSFWKDLPKNKEHVYGKHPNLVLEGDKLSKESFEHTDKLVEKHDVKHQELSDVFYEIARREAQHKSALERLAVKAVAKMFHIPEDEFEAHLSKEVDVNPVSEVPEAAAKHSKLTPKLIDEINKRITSNAFAQGASVHAFLTAHFFDQIEEEIKKIDPELVKLYSKFASGSHHLYWLMNMAELNLGSAAIGSMKPEYDPNTKQMKIVARSPMFVVLVQELAKGAMELRYLKHLQERDVTDLSDEDINTIYEYADRIEDEPKLIQVGPALWRRFLQAVASAKVEEKPVQVYEALMKRSPKHVYEFVDAVVNNPEKARMMVHTLVAKKTFDTQKEE